MYIFLLLAFWRTTCFRKPIITDSIKGVGSLHINRNSLSLKKNMLKLSLDQQNSLKEKFISSVSLKIFGFYIKLKVNSLEFNNRLEKYFKELKNLELLNYRIISVLLVPFLIKILNRLLYLFLFYVFLQFTYVIYMYVNFIMKLCVRVSNSYSY